MEQWYHCNEYPVSWGFAAVYDVIKKAPKEQS